MCVFAQGVFDHRMKTWQKWQDSQMLLQKKREAEAKLQFTNKPDKLQQAKDEIKEVRRSFCGASSPKITFTMIEMTNPIRTHGIIPFLIFLLIWSSKLLLCFLKKNFLCNDFQTFLPITNGNSEFESTPTPCHLTSLFCYTKALLTAQQFLFVH